MWFSVSFWLPFLQKRSQEPVRASRNEEKEPGHFVCSGCWQQCLELTSTLHHAARLPPKSDVSGSAACLGRSHHRRNHLSIALQPAPLAGICSHATLQSLCWACVHCKPKTFQRLPADFSWGKGYKGGTSVKLCHDSKVGDCQRKCHFTACILTLQNNYLPPKTCSEK